ncbi:MAG TPA: NAD(P)H-hydrate dehydratase [Thermoleophilia bacterium]
MDESLLLGLYTADGMQKVDGLAIHGIGIPGGHLMERAGLAVATEILERYAPEEAVVFAGKGNNGGDGFVVARELFDAGVEVTVFLLAPAEEYKGDARLNLDILAHLGVDVRPATDAGREALSEETMMLAEMADVVIDAVFGTGFTGTATGPAAAVIQLMNEVPGTVVSVDIMSGVGAGSGAINGPAVIADLTVALHAAKIGHFVTPGGAFSGEVVIAPIGIPTVCDSDPDVWLLTAEAMGDLVIPKGALDHKRSVGTALVVGGSKGMTGAAHMAAMAALRAGAGLVHAALPEGAHGPKPYPEVITVEVPGGDGQFGLGARSALFEQADQLKAVVVGPGFGRADEAKLLVRELLGIDRPLLLDADGLYALGDKLELLAERRQPTVITPHEGELARLIGRSAADVAGQRLECARSAAKRAGVTVLLKGEATIVADPSGRAYVVPTGNPGLATPGTGDVLSGVIVAQLAKGLAATDAACLGAYLHGLAADLAAVDSVGTEGMVASDLFHYLPAAVERLKAGPREESHEHDH